MTADRADSHDRDKLARWHNDLVSNPPGKFPAYAVFLVTGDDRAAHDVFREFRSSFEERQAGFEHLVIFGQHGVSTTLLGMMSQLGMSKEEIPSLALFSEPGAKTALTLSLTAGGNVDRCEGSESAGIEGKPAESWRAVLNQLEAAAQGNLMGLDLASLTGPIVPRQGSGSMLEMVEQLLRDIP
ncbi:MAG: hypothetical protein BZY88_16680 [SAR202 cluster bacterium Io17-Chloro-G9]|nr:MAG: hypothetical protein BZY88_16680 [SAR202 cluster bacterium Io17-Chloro-G9]